MRVADLLPQSLLPPLSAALTRPGRESGISRDTGLSREQWRDLGRAFPALGPDPGPAAARARRRLQFLVGRALATERHGPRFRPAPPPAEPAVYVTAHLGDLRSLRYLLRRHIPVATVVLTTEEEREAIAREDRAFDARTPRDFPHAFSSRRPHRLRRALSRGSLVFAADLPAVEGAAFPCLGGRISLDPRPIRLAKIAKVPSRPVFLTAPRGRLTITVGGDLPREEDAALQDFAGVLERVAGESPFEIDGPTWWSRLGLR
ncbi:MAG: hypothetical protein ACM3SU_02385 [Acidobacteriota bacterium]